ncbi:TBC1 domain family member 14 [Plakobranchus ocellatus]|uniref:TBC1 domain family member 14 n=1 Tax=Plakobranchus ocellatus TaxID=259542 RepID=A0AAV3YMR9_9GAST|nr:TBC1 domain family member 14 [Plakobranchus ocellatus]
MGKSFPALNLPLVKMKMSETGETNYLETSNCGAGGLTIMGDLDEVEVLKSHLKSQTESWRIPYTKAEDGADDVDDGIGNSTASSVSRDNRFDFESFKEGEMVQDDTDATLSISSDNTLEFEPTDNQLRLQEKRLWDMQLREDGRGSSKSLLSNAQLTQDGELPQLSKLPAAWTDDVSVDIGSSGRFSKVLENISLPLLYIPTTKQLVKSNTQSQTSDDRFGASSHIACEPPIVIHVDPDSPGQAHSALCNGLQSANSTLDLSSAELLPHSPIPKAYSAQEFQHISKLTDSDRLTLHSVDSYPGFHSNAEQNPYNLFADNSSLSSVSTGTDFSVSAVSVGEDYGIECGREPADEALFIDVNLNSRNSYDTAQNKSSSLDSGYGDKKPPDFTAAKKKSFTTLKSLFSKRAKEESPPGWKLFGRVPPKPASARNPHEISSEYQSRQFKVEKPVFPPAGKKQGSEVMSTTALILENRPTNLPSKNPEEAEKHRQQYEEMVEAAKKKELRDLKLKKKQLQQQRKQEDQTMAAARAWNLEVLPNWDAVRNTKKVRDLWWMGLPPSVRGKIWKLAIGNDLNITHGTLDAEEAPNKESSVKVIKLDVSRTFPHLCIFQKGGPFYDLLHNLLGAYACYRPDVGYVQGMSFIAAILLLNMDVADAFVCFANLLNRPCQLAFFRMDENVMTAYYRTFEEFFKENLPKLYAHFSSLSVTPNLYIMEWVFLMYSKSLPLDVACKVWDLFFRDGEEFLFRTAIAILKLYEAVLLKMDFIHVAQFLTKLPENISGDQLFKELESVRMSIDKRGFQAVHAFFKDLHAGTS